MITNNVGELEHGKFYTPVDDKGVEGNFSFRCSVGVYTGLSGAGWPTFNLGNSRDCAINHNAFKEVNF